MAVSTELAAQLKTVLGNLREARKNDPKHGTIAGAPDCDDRCQICFNECYFDYLIDQIPRGLVGTVPDGVVEAPLLGAKFIEPSWYDQAANEGDSNG